MTLRLEPHGHDHHAGHVPVSAVHEDEQLFWLGTGEAYTGLRTSLQLLAGLQLLGVGSGDKTDLRRAVLIRVAVLLDEVRGRLSAISAPGRELPYLNDLAACLESLGEIAGRQNAQLTRAADGTSAEPVHQLLERAADGLRRCQRYDRGLRFFGSGGCADVEHALSHLRAEGSGHD
jgi:hypothetical protein